MSEHHRHDTPPSAVAPGILLWIMVVGGLLYGVAETVQKVSSLFG